MYITKDDIFYIFNDEKIVLVKKVCLTDKSEEAFIGFADHLKKGRK